MNVQIYSFFIQYVYVIFEFCYLSQVCMGFSYGKTSTLTIKCLEIFLYLVSTPEKCHSPFNLRQGYSKFWFRLG